MIRSFYPARPIPLATGSYRAQDLHVLHAYPQTHRQEEPLTEASQLRFAQQLHISPTALPCAKQFQQWRKLQPHMPPKQVHYATLAQAHDILLGHCHPDLSAPSTPISPHQQQQLALLYAYFNRFFPQAYLVAMVMPRLVASNRDIHYTARKGHFPALLQAWINTRTQIRAHASPYPPSPTPWLEPALSTLGCLAISLSLSPWHWLFLPILSAWFIRRATYNTKHHRFDPLRYVHQQYRHLLQEDRRYRAISQALQWNHLIQLTPSPLHPPLQEHPSQRPKLLPTKWPAPAPSPEPEPIQAPKHLPTLQQWIKQTTLAYITPQAQRLLQLNHHLQQDVPGQPTAIAHLCAALRHATFANPSQPMPAFFFIGPKDVGQIKMASSLAHSLWGDNERCTVLDMRQFREAHDYDRLLGRKPQFATSAIQRGWLPDRLQHQPQSVLLFHHIEAAHPRIWTTLQQLVSTRTLQHPLGATLSCKETLFIFNSEHAYGTWEEFFAPCPLVQRSFWQEQLPNPEQPPWTLIGFEPLSKQGIMAHLHQSLKHYNQRLAARHLHIELTPRCCTYLQSTVYDPRFGLASLQRFFEWDVADLISRQRLPNPGPVWLDYTPEQQVHRIDPPQQGAG